MTAANPTAHETLRKGDLDQIAALIESHRIRTIDLSTAGRKLWVAGGNLIVQGVDPLQEIGPDGVTSTEVNGTYAFGEIGVESLAARIGVPSAWLKQIRNDGKLDLFDTVVGYALRGELNGEPSPYTAPDGRLHTLRLLAADGGAPGNEVDGMVRAVLGGNFLALDNLDTLAATMEGMALAGVHPGTFKVQADLSESRMVVKVWMPEIYAYAPAVFGGYVSPFGAGTVDEMPKVYAGLVASNSEVGRGSWSISPRITFQACSNGTNITKDVFKKQHTGEKHDGDGVIKWSDETKKLTLALIKSKTADAVRTFCDADYVTAKLAEMEQAAGVKVAEDPETIITKVTRHTGHTGQRSSILNMYLNGGQQTAGGVMQAYTAAAQIVGSADVAFDLENRAADAMTWVAGRTR
jgi:hypothetical protein